MTRENRIHLRGFASMPVEKRKAIASLGGKAAHVQGGAHQWTSAEAVAAGRKGGLASAVAKKRKAQRASAA